MLGVGATALVAELPSGAWDIGEFLQSAQGTLKEWAGYLLGLMGVVAVCFGGIRLVMKLIATPQTQGQQSSWGMIALMIIIGGALIGGGWNLISDVGSGGERTIRDLGGGTILYAQAALGHLLVR